MNSASRVNAASGGGFLDENDAIFTLQSRHRYAVAKSFSARRRVLDFGCGNGDGARQIAEVASETVGMDLDDRSVASCETAHAGVAKLSFRRGGLAGLTELADGRFDCITCFDVLEHLDEKAQALLLSSFARLLSTSGVLLLSVTDAAAALRHDTRFPDASGALRARGFSAADLSARLEPHFTDVHVLPQLVEPVSLIGLVESQKATIAWSNDEQAGVRLAICGKRKLTLPAGISSSLLPEPHLLEELLERQARLVARIDALTADLLQSRRDHALASRRLREEHAAELASVKENLNKELATAKQTIDSLNQSLAIRATHVLDRWPRARDALKGLGHKLAG